MNRRAHTVYCECSARVHDRLESVQLLPTQRAVKGRDEVFPSEQLLRIGQRETARYPAVVVQIKMVPLKIAELHARQSIR